MESGPFGLAALSALVQVVLIDLTLAGDNAIVVGMAAAGLPREKRHRAILAGIVVATVLRIGFALLAARFLSVIGLTFAGGILLLWVAWKMYREISANARAGRVRQDGAPAPAPAVKTVRQAMLQIAVADVSMSLDNVLAVAGTARNHLWVLVAGLALSVGLMGAASTVVVRLLHRFPWLGWIGLAIITYVALDMIYDGWFDLRARLAR